MAAMAAVMGESNFGRLRAWGLPLIGLALFVLAIWAIHRELSAHPLARWRCRGRAIPWADIAAALAAHRRQLSACRSTIRWR